MACPGIARTGNNNCFRYTYHQHHGSSPNVWEHGAMSPSFSHNQVKAFDLPRCAVASPLTRLIRPVRRSGRCGATTSRTRRGSSSWWTPTIATVSARRATSCTACSTRCVPLARNNPVCSCWTIKTLQCAQHCSAVAPSAAWLPI